MGIKDLPILEVTSSPSAGLGKLVYIGATPRVEEGGGRTPASQNRYPIYDLTKNLKLYL